MEASRSNASGCSSGNRLGKGAENQHVTEGGKVNKDVLTIEYKPVGDNGRISLTVKCGAEVLALDKLDALSAGARERFANGLCKDRRGIDRAEVDRHLLRIAHELQTGKDGQTGRADSAGELDISRIVRPERFIVPEVSGLSVATPTLINGKPAGRWRLYLHWTDGKREVMDLPDSISLPDKSKLWIYPTPGEPSLRQIPAWTERARKDWLAKADLPDPADLFKRLSQCIAYYIDFPKDRAPGTTATLALWVVLTYCYQAWSAIPYLYMGGPAGSGKSRVFEVLSRLVFRPLQSSNMTAAALFRTLNGHGGTLLYDEAERLKQNAPEVGEINSMLLAGYKRGQRATRLEAVGDTYRSVEFDVFGPKAMACIRGLPVALASRCIPVMMFRAAKGSDKPRRRIDAHGGRWTTLRADLHALSLNCGAEFLELTRREDVCAAMSGRSFELWQPLLALASWVEYHGADGLLALMQAHAEVSIQSGQDEQTPDCDETLLRILADTIRCGGSPIAKDILETAKNQEPRMFDSWSAKGAATVMKRYGIETHKTHGRRAYGHVTVDDLRRIEAAYNMDLGLSAIGEDTP